MMRSGGISTVPMNAAVKLFNEIGDAIKSVRSRSSKDIIHYVIQIENVYKNMRRKLLKKPMMDCVFQSALESVINPSESGVVQRIE